MKLWYSLSQRETSVGESLFMQDSNTEIDCGQPNSRPGRGFSFSPIVYVKTAWWVKRNGEDSQGPKKGKNNNCNMRSCRVVKATVSNTDIATVYS